MARNVVLLLSSWGWNWSLILSWAHPPPISTFLGTGQTAQRLLSLWSLLLFGHHGNKCTSWTHGSFTT